MSFQEAIQKSKAIHNPLIFFELMNQIAHKPFIFDTWQKDILEYLTKELPEGTQHKNIFIAVSGARGCGKSRIAALIALWVLSVETARNVIITISANTESQIEKSIWLAFLQLHSELRLDLFLNKSGMRTITSKFKPDNKTFWQVFGSGDDTKLRGIHSDVTVRIIDEALGVEDRIFHTLLSGLTNGLNIVILLSNPITTLGFFADIFLASNEYNFYKKNVSLYDCEHIDKTGTFFASHIDSVQRSDPSGERYRVEILGEFPENSLGFFFGLYDVTEINMEQMLLTKYIPTAVIGIDVASGEGADRTVIAIRIGGEIFVKFVGRIKTPELSERILKFMNVTRNIGIDSAGLGIGVVQAVQYAGGYLYQINGNASSQNSAALNKRAELHIQLKSFLDAGGKVFVPYGQKSILIDELRSIRVEFPDGKRGKLKIIDKTKMTKSPDIVDALTYTFFTDQSNTQPVFYY